MTAPMDTREGLLARVAGIICETTCGLTSECRSREAAQALMDAGLLPVGGDAPAAWQPIETAPKDGSEILLWGNCRPSNSPARYARDANVGWWASDHWSTRVGGEQCDAILWMPIPDVKTLSLVSSSERKEGEA